MNEYHKFIQDTYNWARYMGICRTKSEFAKIVGVCPSTISASSQERYSGKNTARKVKAWLDSKPFVGKPGNDETPIIQCDSEQRPVYYSEALVKEMMAKKEFDWKAFRAEASARILAGIADSKTNYATREEERSLTVRIARSLADELIKQLRDGQ